MSAKPNISNMKLPRDKTIGILGGGQLGRMLAMAAGRLGFHVIILEPQENCPALRFADEQIVAAYDDEDALNQLATRCHVITYEFENVPVAAVQKIGDKCRIAPGANALETSQDRLVEKNFIQSLGIKVAPFEKVSSLDDLAAAMPNFADGAILKTRRFGYDGKGQIRIAASDDLSSQQMAQILGQPCVLEALVDFEREISVVAARAVDGQVKCYDAAQNVHENGILATSTVPANISPKIEKRAQKITESVLNALEYVGVIALEFFVTRDEQLLVNEFAPRVHNSGHWTEAACAISQFEQHIRAITGLALGDPMRHSDCQMHNLLGDSINKLAELATLPNTVLHDYGKADAKPGRKMGHYTKITPRKPA